MEIFVLVCKVFMNVLVLDLVIVLRLLIKLVLVILMLVFMMVSVWFCLLGMRLMCSFFLEFNLLGFVKFLYLILFKVYYEMYIVK